MKYKKTELGQQAFKERNSAVSVRQRSALIMVDGEKDDSIILKSLSAMGLTVEDLKHLFELGLIEPLAGQTIVSQPNVAEPASTSSAAGEALQTPVVSEQERYQRAYLVASKLTSGLGLRGFRLNMSVESASNYKDLLAIAPKIREAVGDEKFAELARALSTS